MNKKTLVFLLIYFMIADSCNAQTREDSLLYKFFIDFLKQEILYHEDVAYYPFPFEDIDCGHLFERQIVDTPEQMSQLIGQSIAYDSSDSTIYYKSKLELPHRIKIDVLDNEHYHAEAFVVEPDSSATLHFNEATIGTPQCFDKTEITLLGLESDVAYLLLEDKSKLIDYSYTQPGYVFDDDDQAESKKVEREWRPYAKEGEISGYSLVCTKADGGVREYGISRISAVVRNVKGVVLDFASLCEDFRHYLWYRNMDMPYGRMERVYNQLQERYAQMGEGYQCYPLYVVRLQASGCIDNLAVTIHSRDMRPPVQLELTGKFVPRYDYYENKPTLEEMMRQISSIRNSNADTLILKPVVAPYAYHPGRNTLVVAAYLPFCYNTQNWDAMLRFSSLAITSIEGIVTLKGDEIEREDLFRRNYLSQGPYGDAIDLAVIPAPISSSDTLRGELWYSYPDCEATCYDMSRLPQNWCYKEKGNTLFVPHDDFHFLDTNNGYDEQGRYNPIVTDVVCTDKGYELSFERPLKTYIVIKKVKTIQGTTSFSLPLPSGPPS